MNRTAQCSCGQLSIEVQGESEIHGVCHCQNCRKRTGSAFGISAYFNNKNILQIRGDANCYKFHHDEQNHDQARYFCKQCGNTLYWTISTMPDVTGIAGGCFVEQPLGEPNFSTHHSQKCAWLSLPEQWATKP